MKLGISCNWIYTDGQWYMEEITGTDNNSIPAKMVSVMYVLGSSASVWALCPSWNACWFAKASCLENRTFVPLHSTPGCLKIQGIWKHKYCLSMEWRFCYSWGFFSRKLQLNKTMSSLSQTHPPNRERTIIYNDFECPTRLSSFKIFSKHPTEVAD